MADTILAVHPLRTLLQDSDLSCVLDLENPFYMTLERLEGLISAEPTAEIRAYLFGLYDMRRAAVYAGGA
ncbi:conserved hypothetical protein [Cupriavidus phytorum]|uniref:Uncharacterized protein n=1 Tax=Cupriavidus taiwanensis TaxID=164546 RepID=A0A975XAG0_9BURK|nr:hypothetical protein [Cupriavidus taiwanensis]SOY62192.1 conserved hypothetical protein [Cupriavidus taiwanensis]